MALRTTYESLHRPELGSIQEAQKLLDAGYRVIEQFSPDMRGSWPPWPPSPAGVPMVPVQPLRPRDFRLAQIASLAYLNQSCTVALSRLDVERFRLRIYILGRSFALAPRSSHSTQAIVRNEPRRTASGSRSTPSATTSST